MAKYNKTKPLTLMQQKLRLQKLYPNLIERIEIVRNELTCIMRLQPSNESRIYTVKISFKLRYWPKVWLLQPKVVERFDGKKPHHIYNPQDEGPARLCTFYPKANEWNDRMFLAEVFVPWIITWLSAYEYWQITGQWVYPESNAIKSNKE